MKTKLGASAEVYYKQVQLVRQVLQHAMDKKLVPNIIIKPDLPKRPTTRRAAINANGQWAKLTGYLAARANAIDKDKEYERWFIRRMLHCYVLVMGYTGCRSGEARLLRFCDFGAYTGGDPAYIHIPDAKTGDRDFYNGDLAGVLAALRSIHPTPDDPKARVFVRSNGSAVDEYHHAFKEVLRELAALDPNGGWEVDAKGQAVTLYSLRHMVATGMI